MTPQPGLQTITIHILPNISQSNGQNFGQLIDHNMRNIFLQKLCGNESGRLVPDLFLFFKKA